MRVSTYALNQGLLRSAMQVQTSLAEALTQQASGLVGDTYGDLGSKSKVVLDFQSELSATETSVSMAETASNRVQTMYDAVGNMVDLLTQLRSALSETLSDGTTTNLTTTARGILADLAAQINVQYGDRYLFSGSATDTAPVDLSSYPSGTLDTVTADISYYQGNDSEASITLSSGQTITYGVTGDNAAFEAALRVAAIATQLATDPIDSSAVQAAYDLATETITALSDLQTGISNSSSRLSDAQTSLESYATQLQGYIGDLKEVDSAEIATKVSQYQTQLESSYAAVSTILKISLADYL